MAKILQLKLKYAEHGKKHIKIKHSQIAAFNYALLPDDSFYFEIILNCGQKFDEKFGWNDFSKDDCSAWRSAWRAFHG